MVAFIVLQKNMVIVTAGQAFVSAIWDTRVLIVLSAHRPTF
jgi:hypothetical protein